jgi:hypothetical protein
MEKPKYVFVYRSGRFLLHNGHRHELSGLRLHRGQGSSNILAIVGFFLDDKRQGWRFCFFRVPNDDSSDQVAYHGALAQATVDSENGRVLTPLGELPSIMA